MNDDTADASAPTTAPPPPRRRRTGLWWLLPVVLLALGGWGGWRWWLAQEDARRVSEHGASQQLQALEARLDLLRRDLRAQAQRLQQAETTNRVLRDEVIGVGQRAAILEDSLSRLTDPRHAGPRALRLDEIELLLGQGQQRLHLAGDLDGARRAYALAARTLSGLDDPDPALVNLRQALAQERAALEALGEDPRRIAAGRLDAFAAALTAMPAQPAVAAGTGTGTPVSSWWQRAFARLVDVRRSDTALTLAPADRAAGLAALQLELGLARVAIERRDADGLGAALERADAWLTRLWPASPQRRRQRQTLVELRTLPLSPDLPALGSTLEQLRALRAPD